MLRPDRPIGHTLGVNRRVLPRQIFNLGTTSAKKPPQAAVESFPNQVRVKIMSDKSNDAAPIAGGLDETLGQVLHCLTEYAQGNLENPPALTINSPWQNQFTDQFQNLRRTLSQLLIEANERTQREQTTRQIMTRIQTATTLPDLLKVTAQVLGEYMEAEIAFIELGMESVENSNEAWTRTERR